ncbi:hypothetical protein GV792_00815 [Nocardia cyriacigeorgica]|uniref:Saccharopine dehydrogenase NADP binding domain-containing protein n=1 Tax=Nocardia cyriacigeorgica TaxID=135487 RepID=A0A6P1CXU1_9NOCA|nr:saccharopine dehydrogenase NADP-binding domain-containing protein [Nocardia cyriacigeorgica]NEW42926.1 hypothetical protein [Nocardia cyriacigeorgica]NEW48599.1 hypothetical protein [Nocardia cyriacigeorgica]
MKVVVIGAGAFAAEAARLICRSPANHEVVIADADPRRCRTLAEEIGARTCDLDPYSAGEIGRLCRGADLAFNTLTTRDADILRVAGATIAAGAHYVDAADGRHGADRLVHGPGLDRAARAAGVTVLMGIGFSPGLTDLIAGWAAQSFDSAPEIAIRKTRGHRCLPGQAARTESTWQVVARGEAGGRATRVVFGGFAGHNHSLAAHTAAVAIDDILSGMITTRGLVGPQDCIEPEPFVLRVLDEAGSSLRRFTSETTDIL